MQDCETLLAFAGADPAADATRAGAVGYCMSGRYALNAVGRFEGLLWRPGRHREGDFDLAGPWRRSG